MYRFGEEEVEAVAEVLRSGHWFRYGDPAGGHLQQAAQFEEELARITGSQYACFTSSGTAALMCCYAAIGVGPGDEVIIPGYTWIASALAPLAMGAIPVIVDVDESLMIDPAAVEKAITPRTKAITPVHMVGFMADMERICTIAERHKLFVVEDACQCDGGIWSDGRRAGAIGHAGAYSFNYYKVISCGDGGAFITNDRQMYERGLIFHDGGAIFRPHAAEIGVEFFCGMNLRGNEILAAVMRQQLLRLEGIIADLHRARTAILDILAQDPAVQLLLHNGGSATGTGATIGLLFASEPDARAFCAAFNSSEGRCGTGAGLPVDSGRHVYSNWEPVISRRGSYSAAADPFLHPLNAGSDVSYCKGMLPRTTDILSRAVLIAVNPDWQAAQCAEVASAIRETCSAAAAAATRGHSNERTGYELI